MSRSEGVPNIIALRDMGSLKPFPLCAIISTGPTERQTGICGGVDRMFEDIFRRKKAIPEKRDVLNGENENRIG